MNCYAVWVQENEHKPWKQVRVFHFDYGNTAQQKQQFKNALQFAELQYGKVCVGEFIFCDVGKTVYQNF